MYAQESQKTTWLATCHQGRTAVSFVSSQAIRVSGGRWSSYLPDSLSIRFEAPLSLSASVCMHARPLAIDIHPRGTQGHRIKPTCRGLSRLSSPTTPRPLEPQHHLPLPAPEPVQLYLLVIAPPCLPTSEGNGAGWRSSLRPSTSATGEAPCTDPEDARRACEEGACTPLLSTRTTHTQYLKLIPSSSPSR